MMKKLFDKNDVLSLKYYLVFSILVLAVYAYSMTVGWRFLSFGESHREKNKGASSLYHHK